MWVCENNGSAIGMMSLAVWHFNGFKSYCLSVPLICGEDQSLWTPRVVSSLYGGNGLTMNGKPLDFYSRKYSIGEKSVVLQNPVGYPFKQEMY
jgi:hypothetical protein